MTTPADAMAEALREIYDGHYPNAAQAVKCLASLEARGFVVVPVAVVHEAEAADEARRVVHIVGSQGGGWTVLEGGAKVGWFSDYDAAQSCARSMIAMRPAAAGNGVPARESGDVVG